MVDVDDAPNTGKSWTDGELRLLRELVESNMPTRLIAERLGRSEYSVRSKASHVGIHLAGARTQEGPPKPR